MSFKEELVKRKLTMDGALGTELEELVPRDSPVQPKSSRLWSGMVLLHQPELVTQVHQAYVEAGAEALITGTYQISEASLKKNTSLSDQEIIDLWSLSVEVACQAAETADHKVFVLGSIGPYATCLADGSEYTGKYGDISVEQLTAYHKPLALYLAGDSRVDVLAFETIPNLIECQAILELLAANKISKSFYISFNFSSTELLMDGTPIAKMAEYLTGFLHQHPEVASNFVGIGVNCTEYQLVESIVENINAAISMPLILYPNLGFDYDEVLGEYQTKKNVEKWARLVEKWCSFDNVRVIGGCCGTAPVDITAVKKVLDSLPHH
ncbi:AdoMet-homocysteine methyltransferase [Suhomyces tanzawaensis NRRL Y-17324]|uniref:AdoMet-homocysteine methyltransferase n=1 Tax=Suhomyces tanzawaensis NRRL Y-17324 TaxID=984487 RepID=A0A1E4SNK4_9ASCO|nr:AdoMet-homocysteine methyltransferase [Suhomyces tanzawaensis NRRL Y-17324]ODV80962.1 AdoMet-homocysteine methyltransferase [Suhomyces tanzawaensis NRRL Y-17324]